MAKVDTVIKRNGEEAWVVVAKTKAERETARKYNLPVGKGLDHADAQNLHDRLVSLTAANSSD